MTGTHDDTIRDSAPQRPAPVGVLVGFGGDPLTVGLVFFGIASVALGMALIGMPTAAQGAVIPIIVLGSGLYQLLVTIWAAILGQSIVAVIFSTFSAFWLSFSALVLGLVHGWFGISAADATGAQELFFIAWACLFLFLVIPCLKLPLVYPLAVALMFVAVSLAAIGGFTGFANVFTAAGAVALTFAFLAFYAWVNVALVAMGGKGILPLGKFTDPLMSGSVNQPRTARGELRFAECARAGARFERGPLVGRAEAAAA